MARVYLKGLPQLKAKLVRLKEQTAESVMPAMGKAAQLIVDMMKRQVPVDHGDLRDSIGWTFGDKPKYAQAITTARFGQTRVTIFAGNAKVRYAHLIEFGTAPHTNAGIFAGSENPGARSQPFFFPSYRALRKDAQKIIRLAIRDAVRKAVT